MEGIINIQDFTNYLKDNNLIIISRFDYEESINSKDVTLKKYQEKLLSKEYLDLKEVLAAKLLPIKSRQSIINWINRGVFKPGESFISPDDGRVKLITQAVIRVRKIKNYGV